MSWEYKIYGILRFLYMFYENFFNWNNNGLTETIIRLLINEKKF